MGDSPVVERLLPFISEISKLMTLSVEVKKKRTAYQQEIAADFKNLKDGYEKNIVPLKVLDAHYAKRLKREICESAGDHIDLTLDSFERRLIGIREPMVEEVQVLPPPKKNRHCQCGNTNAYWFRACVYCEDDLIYCNACCSFEIFGCKANNIYLCQTHIEEMQGDGKRYCDIPWCLRCGNQHPQQIAYEELMQKKLPYSYLPKAEFGTVSFMSLYFNDFAMFQRIYMNLIDYIQANSVYHLGLPIMESKLGQLSTLMKKVIEEKPNRFAPNLPALYADEGKFVAPIDYFNKTQCRS